MNFEKIQYIERKTGEIKTEKVMGEGALKFLYYNPFGKLALHTVVKRKFLSDWYGRKMSKPESKEKIKSFVEEMGIDMSEYKRPIEDYTSFNDFFYRELKDGARKIDYNEDVIVSPADGKILAYQNIKEIDKFSVKGSEFTLEEFFNDKELALYVWIIPPTIVAPISNIAISPNFSVFNIAYSLLFSQKILKFVFIA